MGVAVVLVSAAAHAEPTLELTWRAPAECPQEAAVRERVRALTGESARPSARLRAQGVVTSVAGRYRLSLSIREGSATRERTIDSDSCVDLAGAAAVALGLLLRNDPSSHPADAGQPGSEDAAGTPGTSGATGGDSSVSPPSGNAPPRGDDRSAAKPSRAAETPPTTDSSSSADSASARRWSILLRVPEGSVELGRVPAPTVGLGGGLGLRYDGWRWLVSGRLDTAQTVGASVAGVGARLHPFSLDLRGCYGWRSASLEVAPCVAAALQWLTARGDGQDVIARTRTTRSVLLGAGGALHLYMTEWLAVVGGVTAGVKTSRERISVDGFGEIARLAPVQLDVTLGSEWIF